MFGSEFVRTVAYQGQEYSLMAGQKTCDKCHKPLIRYFNDYGTVYGVWCKILCKDCLPAAKLQDLVWELQDRIQELEARCPA